MLKRFKTIGAATAALAALALGGSAIASATQSTASAKHHAATKAEKTTGPDTDSVQSGDQTSPDTQGVASEKTTGPDTDSVQSGDQTSPDPKGAKSSTSASEPVVSETAPETSSESSTPSDGPGGHEDPAGEVENQSEAEE
jgi:hypothetical protein